MGGGGGGGAWWLPAGLYMYVPLKALFLVFTSSVLGMNKGL